MRNRLMLVMAGLLILAVVLGACAPAALGTEENPLVWAFVPSGEMETVAAGADSIAALLFEETGLVVDTFVATDYAGVIEAMCSEPPKAHMASLATFAYLLAHERGCAEAELVSVRFGSAKYNGQIIVRADSGITDISQLNGKTFCRGDEFSTSGWIIPSIEMQAAGVDLSGLTIVDTGGHPTTVVGVLNGDCDAGATYVDARTAVEGEYPSVMDDLVVISISTDIPNDGLQFQPGTSREIRDKINAGLLAIAGTEDGVAALKTAYSWQALEAHDHSFYVPFLELLDAAGMAPADLLK